MHKKTYWFALLGSSSMAAALVAPTLGFAAAGAFPTTFNPTVAQAMDYVSGRTRLTLNAPAAIPQWQQGYLSATANASADSYRVDLWDTRAPLPLSASAVDSNKLFSGGASFGELKLAAPLARSGSPGYLTPLIRHNPMWIGGTAAPSGSLALGNGVRAVRYRVNGKTLLEWSEGDWTIQVGGPDAAPAARTVVRLLNAAFLPPYPGVYAVNTGQGNRAVTAIDWVRGRTLSWVENRHGSPQNPAATGRMAMSWRAFATAGTYTGTSRAATRIRLGRLGLTLPAGWTRTPGAVLSPGTKSVRATGANGARVTLQKIRPTRSNLFLLLPQLPKPAGLTSNAWNRRPYFTESRTVIDGVIQFQMTDLTASGTEYVVTLQAPSQAPAVVDSIERSTHVPPPATVKDAVHLLLTNSHPGTGLPLAMAQAVPDDSWVLAGGQPATAQEGWFLFHSQNGGKTWRVEADTTWSAPFKTFPNSVGTPAMLFWNAKDGLIAMPSYAASDLLVYRTQDGGTSWTKIQVASPGQLNVGKAPEITRQADGQLTITASLYSRNPVHQYSGKTVQFVSNDGGGTWARS